MIRKLASHSLVYGAADVFTNVVNFLLVPLYTAFLRPQDYGTLALLLLFSTVAKIAFRMGLDSGFFRVHYDLDDERRRRRLAGSVAVFAAILGTALFGLVVLLREPLNLLLFSHEAPGSRLLLLAAADVWLGCFAFVPLNLLRIQDRPGLFSTLSGLRHLVNTVLKVVLVVRGHGVEGILWSDLLATGLFSLSLLPILLRHASFCLDLPLLRETLAFALPKVPHGILVQALNLADRKILDLFVSRAEVGLYQVGYTFGSGVKFALSAFEPAWQPFVYSQIRKPDAPRTLARVASYAFLVFACCGLGLATLGRELLVLMTPKSPEFRAAAAVIPVVALAYVLHGAFLLGSIGIGIEKRAGYYPLVTALSAAANIAANFVLIPPFGMLGAAWATVIAYAVMAGSGFVFSRRLYPIPFEWPRLARIVAAALACFAASRLAPEALWPAVAVKGLLLLGFPLLLAASGFLTPEERLRAGRLLRGAGTGAAR